MDILEASVVVLNQLDSFLFCVGSAMGISSNLELSEETEEENNYNLANDIG
jgi:hypothetical protein